MVQSSKRSFPGRRAEGENVRETAPGQQGKATHCAAAASVGLHLLSMVAHPETPQGHTCSSAFPRLVSPRGLCPDLSQLVSRRLPRL